MPAWLTADPEGVTLEVLVQPRASRTRAMGEHDGRLKIQIAAPPVEGEANAALIKYLSSACGVPRRDVRVVRGETGRRKTVRLEGAGGDAVRAALA